MKRYIILLSMVWIAPLFAATAVEPISSPPKLTKKEQREQRSNAEKRESVRKAIEEFKQEELKEWDKEVKRLKAAVANFSRKFSELAFDKGKQVEYWGALAAWVGANVELQEAEATRAETNRQTDRRKSRKHRHTDSDFLTGDAPIV